MKPMANDPGCLFAAYTAGPRIMRGQRGTLGAWHNRTQHSRRSTDSRQHSRPGVSGTQDVVVARLSSQHRSLLPWTPPSALVAAPTALQALAQPHGRPLHPSLPVPDCGCLRGCTALAAAHSGPVLI